MAITTRSVGRTVLAGAAGWAVAACMASSSSPAALVLAWPSGETLRFSWAAHLPALGQR